MATPPGQFLELQIFTALKEALSGYVTSHLGKSFQSLIFIIID